MKLQTVQAMRGLAALGVASYHSALVYGDILGGITAETLRMFLLGTLGVDMFFVISGYIIYSRHAADPPTRSALGIYLGKRLTRIFPPYWPVSIGLLLIYWLSPGLTRAPPRDISLLTSLFLLPDNAEPALVPAWTLVYELQFYLIFCIYFISRRAFAFVLALWAAAIAFAWASGIFSGFKLSPELYHLLGRINFEFMFGMAIAWIAARVPPRLAVLCLIGGIAASVAVMMEADPLVYRVWFAAAFAIAMLGMIVLEEAGKIAVPMALVLLGDASYAIYLTHDPGVSVVLRGVEFAAPGVDWRLGVTFVIAVVVIGGLIYHRVVDLPLIALARSAIRTIWRPAPEVRAE